MRTVAVLDVGKSNAKVAAVSAETGAEVALRTTPNVVRQDGPYPHFDAAMLWDFFLSSLAELRREHAIDAISITTHGAAGVLITGEPEGDGLALPILDYEHDGPDELAVEYDAVRPDFSETLSPRMPAGLNLGAQLFWQERRFPDGFGTARHFVTYAQYWGWRLTGLAVTEVTLLGSHTDLWRPAEKTWSSMVDDCGWRSLMAPIRPAFDQLGPVKPELAARMGLPPGIPVMCGIHDSNASLLPHLLSRDPPFAVVSTGTWIIVLAVGGRTDRLDPTRDGLAYVNAFGDPVPAGRFMGGREFERLTAGEVVELSPAHLDRVLSDRIMALPSFTGGTGPFPRRRGAWTVDPATLSAGERTAAATLYLALMTAECLEIAGAAGPVVVEGPFTGNRLFGAALSGIIGRPVAASQQRTGTTAGAALLARPDVQAARAPVSLEPLRGSAFERYVRIWRDAVLAD